MGLQGVESAVIVTDLDAIIGSSLSDDRSICYWLPVNVLCYFSITFVKFTPPFNKVPLDFKIQR